MSKSIMKLILMAALLSAGAVAEGSTYTCTGGSLAIPDTNTWVSATAPSCSGSSVGWARKVTLTLTFTHPRPSDLHFLVEAYTGYFTRSAWVMGAAGGNSPFTGTITLDDASLSALPASALTNGATYRPARYHTTVPPPPAAVGFGSNLYVLNGTTNEPEIALYALDHIAGSTGSVTGWTIAIDFTGAPYAAHIFSLPSIFWQTTTLGQVQSWELYPATPAGPNGILNSKTYNVNGAWHLGLSGDFNGDGEGDLVWLNDATHDVQIWLMDTSGDVTGTRSFNVAPPWQLAAAGHFYPRDIWDLVWMNTAAGVMQIWFMDGGSANVAGTQNYSVGPGWSVQDVGDFSGRGQHDILWRGPGVAQIWQMDGPTIKPGGTNFNVPDGWVVGGVGDFDGDGRDDIVWINNVSGTGQIWLMQDGNTIKAAQNFPLPPAPWTLINVQPYRLTGTANMLWYNSALNIVQVWTMNGFNITSAENLGAGTGWTPH